MPDPQAVTIRRFLEQSTYGPTPASLAQYGATLARWFGATEPQLDAIFPELVNFAARDVGFFA